MSFKYYILLPIVWVCLCFPSDAFGQYIKKETVNSQVYAVIYAEGLAGSAQWVSGFKMMKNDATIRHQVSRGNGGNPIVNDRIPMRFIIAPTDVANVTWMQAEGAGDGNGNLNADFRSTAATGCRSYKIAGDPNRKWRVPTQRELQLMWLFREPVGIIYPAAQMENVSSKIYWAATEEDAANAWYFDFKQGVPQCSWQLKTTSRSVLNKTVPADYLSIMYPELDDFAEAFFTSDGDCLPFLPVTEPCLLNLSDYYNTLVSDTHIQVSVPPTVYSYRNGYDKWCTKLFVDKNKLHILKHQ